MNLEMFSMSRSVWVIVAISILMVLVIAWTSLGGKEDFERVRRRLRRDSRDG